MGKRINKRTILENVVFMDMETFKKNKGALSKDDKIHITDKENEITEEIEISEEDESKL